MRRGKVSGRYFHRANGPPNAGLQSDTEFDNKSVEWEMIMENRHLETYGRWLNLGVLALVFLFALTAIVGISRPETMQELTLLPTDNQLQQTVTSSPDIASSPRVRLVKSSNRATPKLESIDNKTVISARQQ